MPTRVTKYLGGTGENNTNKLNVHPTLNKVSIGADVFGEANLSVWGNAFVSGNATIAGNLFVLGTQFVANTGVLVSNANVLQANSFFLAKFPSDINPSNGIAFFGSNSAVYTYTLRAMDFDRGANTQIHGNIHVGTGIWASNNLLGIGTKGPNATIHTTGNLRVGSNAFIGPAFNLHGNTIDNINTVRFSSYEGVRLLGGTTAQRPSQANGTIRFNNTFGILEATNNGNTWYDLRYRLSNVFLGSENIGRPTANMYVGSATMQNKVYVFQDPAKYDSTISEIRVSAVATGRFPIRIFNLDTSTNTFTQSGPDYAINLPSAGTVHVLNANSYPEIPVLAGQYIGFHSGGTTDGNGKIARSAGNVTDGKGYVTSETGNVSTFSNNITIWTANRAELGFTLTRTSNTSGDLKMSTDRLVNNFTYFESSSNIGRQSAASLGGTTTTGLTTYIPQTAITAAGRVSAIRANVVADGLFYLKRYTRAAQNTFTQVQEHVFSIQVGKNTYGEIDYGYIPVNAGEYLGFFAYNRVALSSATTADSNGYISQANYATNVASNTYTTSTRLEVGFDLATPIANLATLARRFENDTEHLVWGDVHSRMFTNQVPGAPEYKYILPANVINDYGRTAQVINSANTVASVSPLYVDSNRLIQVNYKLHRETVGGNVSANSVTYGISWLDKNYAVLSNTAVERVKDFEIGNVISHQVIVASSNNNTYGDYFAPAGAVWMTPYVQMEGISHTTHVVQIDKKYLDMSDAKVDLFDGLRTNLRAAWATYRVVKGYTGPLFKLLREADNAQRDFYAGANGYPNISEIKNWLNSNVGFFSTVYDQATNRRHAIGDGDSYQMPTIAFPGVIPVVNTFSTELAFGGAAGGIARNVGNLSMVIQRVNIDVSSVGSLRSYIGINQNGSGYRASLYSTAGVQSGVEGNSAVGGRRLDAHSTVVSLGLYPAKEQWQIQAGALDYVASTATTWVGNRKHTATNFFTGSGNTSDSTSTAGSIGTFRGAWSFGAVFGHALNDDEVALINHRSIDLNTSTSDTSTVFPGSWSFFSYPYTTQRNGTLYTGVCDLRGHTYIHTKPNGGMVEIANVSYEQSHPSDHLAPTLSFLPDGRLFACYTGHGLNNNCYYRLSTDEQVKNLKPEVALTQSSFGLNAEYNQVYIHANSNTMAIFSQSGDTFWGVHVCNNITRPDLVFQRFQNLTNYATTTYQFAGMYNQNELVVFPHITPNLPNNNVHIFSANVITGEIFTTGNTYGYWNGAAGSTTLPINISNLPKIWTIQNNQAVRLMDSTYDGKSFLSGMSLATAATNNVMLILSRFTGSNIYSEASWTHSNVAALGGFYEFENFRFGGACFGNDPHVGVRIYASINTWPTYKLVRFDSLAGDGSDWTTTLITTRNNSAITMLHSPVNATSEEPVWFREILAVDGVTSSKSIGVLVQTPPTNKFLP